MLVTGRPPFQEANDSETLVMIFDCVLSKFHQMFLRNVKSIHFNSISNQFQFYFFLKLG